MVWAKSRIKEELVKGKLIVGPDEETRFKTEELSFDTTSLEVHLGPVFQQWAQPTGGKHSSIDPSDNDYDYKVYLKENTEVVACNENGTYTLEGGKLILCRIFEYISLPKNLFARVESKSKIAQLGISVHNTAPAIHSGWDGNIMLEIFNHSKTPVILKPSKSKNELGLMIAQIFFEEVKEQTVMYKHCPTFLKFLRGVSYCSALRSLLSLFAKKPF